MAAVDQVLVCEKCGNEVRVTKEGGNPHVDCCGEHMQPKQD
jgi:hypothetical protein